MWSTQRASSSIIDAASDEETSPKHVWEKQIFGMIHEPAADIERVDAKLPELLNAHALILGAKMEKSVVAVDAGRWYGSGLLGITIGLMHMELLPKEVLGDGVLVNFASDRNVDDIKIEHAEAVYPVMRHRSMNVRRITKHGNPPFFYGWTSQNLWSLEPTGRPTNHALILTHEKLFNALKLMVTNVTGEWEAKNTPKPFALMD